LLQETEDTESLLDYIDADKTGAEKRIITKPLCRSGLKGQ